jgi:hypothetical protein
MGRGVIKDRLASQERRDWDFDRVEFSIIANSDDQVRWETYWLENHQKANSGKLPVYNRIAGASIPSEIGLGRNGEAD